MSGVVGRPVSPGSIRWRLRGGFALLLILASASVAVTQPHPQKVMLVVLENTDYEEALAQPFMAKLAREGGLLTNYFSVTHPSQPNYLAMTAGSTHEVTTNETVTLDVRHVGDLLEAKGKTWKVYAEGYPGGCFLRPSLGPYLRKHVPFLSFRSVQENPARCQRIVDASQLSTDVRKGSLADYSLYVPDRKNDGHDTGATHADRWLSKAFGPLLTDPRFMQDMVLIVTFDEGRPFDGRPGNHVYAVFYGESVVPGSVSKDRYDHYSLLRTIEDIFGLGSLGREDAKASPVTGIWRH